MNKLSKTLFFASIIAIITFATNEQAMAQNHVCDSILALPVSRQHIDLLLEQTIYKKELKHYTLKALELAEGADYIEGVMHALDQLGVMERNDSHFAEALSYHNRCLQLAESQHAEHWLMRSYINKGVVYRRIDEYEKALQYFLKAFPLAEKLENQREIASCLGNIGTLYLSLNKLDDAMIYIRKSLSKAIEQNNHQGLAISYGSMGRVYENLMMLDSAQYCYEQSLFYSMQWNDNNGIAIGNNNLGGLAKKRGNLQKALEYYRKALEISIVVGDRNNIAPNYANLGEVYLLLGNLENAEKNYRQSLQIAQDAGLKKSMANALGGLSVIFEKQNRTAEALHAVKRQMALKDSVLNEENMRQIELLKISYDILQKEQTIATLQVMHEIEQLKNRQKQIALLASAGLLALFVCIIIMRTRRNRILAEMNSTKDKFFSIISHDLKNPALTQCEALKMLAENSGLWNAEQMSAYHIELLKSAEEQVELIYNLLGWSQVQTGRISYKPNTFLLSNLQPNLTLIHKMAENKGIALNIQIPADMLITGDINILTTVIRNLLTNAIKFTETGGTVSLGIFPVSSNSSKYTVTVSDTGIGINREQLQTLFRIDKRESQRGTAGEQGTGLGLVVCKELLEMHRSTLHVESEQGKGSKFWFTV
ncbi:MAG: tetratricopeptide repeat protein [Bacteroidales bacterium]|jgi:signal transduction histidine kinase|nr:tetratricopeptide repeat protein [Bacteroidales bacterium]